MNLLSRILPKLPWIAFWLIFVVIRTSRRAGGKDLRTVVRRNGLTWSLDLRETIDLWIYLTGSFQRFSIEALERLIRPGDVVMDIGANIGSHTLFMAKAAGLSGEVHAFEPTDFAYEKLRRNLELNPALSGRVQTHQILLGDNSAGGVSAGAAHSSWPLEATVGVHPSHGGALMPAIGATSSTLDDFCRQRAIARVNVVKIDVDGNECGVLRGGRSMLARHRPLLVLELSPCVYSEAAPDRFEDFVEILRELRYRLLNEGTFVPLRMDIHDLTALVPLDGAINAVAIPEEKYAAGSQVFEAGCSR